jgi:hypothetical protein
VVGQLRLHLLHRHRGKRGLTQSGQNTFQQLFFPIPAGSGILSIYFNITNMPYSNTLLLVSFAPITLNLTAQQLSSLVATAHPLLSYMNLMAAIGDSPQLINIYVPSTASTLYVGMFNFDLPEVISSKSYFMKIEFSNNIKICEKCPPGSTNAGLSCQCSPCYSNAIGPACQYSLTPLTTSANFTVPTNQNRYFLISGGSSVQISAQEVTLTGGVTLYAQYQYISDQYPDGVLAGKINTAYLDTQPAQIILSSTVATLDLPSKGLNILLTFHNYGSATASVAVSIPTTPTTTVSITTIMAVVFSLLGLAIIIVFVYRIRRYLTARNSIVLNVGPAVMADHNSLIDAEVNKYFPEVSAAILLQTDINASSSEININNESSVNRAERIDNREMVIECSICFDEVNASHLARVTYCRHIFHSNCLLEWFHKNQVTPA